MRRWWFGVLIGLAAGQAQAQVPGAAPAQAPAAGPAQAPVAGALVTRVDLVGFKRVLVENVRGMLPVKVGQIYDKEAVSASREWLESLGLFLSVTTDTKAADQGVAVTVSVVENPPAGVVWVEGTAEIAGAALRQGLKTQPKQILSKVQVGRDSLYIAAEYRKIGRVVEVEAAFQPEPAPNGEPVNVTFKVTQLQVGRVVCEPLHYVREETIRPFIVLQSGEPLLLQRMVDQQTRLADFKLFSSVGEPAMRPRQSNQDPRVEIHVPVQEADHPLLVPETLPLVDLDKLRQWIRFAAVDINVGLRDLELYRTPAEVADELARAREAVRQRPADGEAAWQLVRWSRQAGLEVTASLDDARRALETQCQAAPTAQGLLRLGQVYQLQGRGNDAVTQFEAVLAAKPTSEQVAATYAELINALGGLMAAGSKDATDKVAVVGPQGAEVLAQLPKDSSVDALTDAFRFYFVGLSLARLNVNMKLAFRLDSRLAGRLLQGLAELGASVPKPDQPDVANPRADTGRRLGHHLGKLLTCVGFVARAVGPDVVGAAALADQLPDLLDAAHEAFLAPGRETSVDPMVPFFCGLNALLRAKLPEARAEALAGIARYPLSDRLVDLYVVCCLENLYTDLNGDQARKSLENSLAELAPELAAGRLNGYGPALLLAKLHLGLYQALPLTEAAPRQTELLGAVTAATLATQRAPEQPMGWWMLGLAQIKGPTPGDALVAYRKVAELQQGNPEARYAVALAKLLAGDTAGGMAAMKALQPQPEPTPTAPVGPPAPAGQP